MTEKRKCPTCESEISADEADGLCLKCLGRLGFVSETGGPKSEGWLRLGDYELLSEIARGGMGVVYRARQLSLNRIVALKVVLNGPFSGADFVRRFRNEAEIVAALRHPNIVTVYEVGEHGGTHFLSLEFVDGRNFSELVSEQPLPALRAAAYLKTIAEAVAYAHQRGVLHRDLKPSNILLDVFDQPRVTDFGLAKMVGGNAELTTVGQVLGSPNYMPPEQAAGKFSDSTAQSDIYSLGAVLYELLTRRAPFQGETIQSVLAQVQGDEPVPPRRLNPGIPVDLQTICLKCLQKEPARRYASARELAGDLGRFLEGKPVLARPVSALERTWLWCRRRPLLAAVSAGLVLAVVLGVAGIVWQWRLAEFHARGELRQRLIAESDAAETRSGLYAADVAEASQAIQNGNFGLARRTLERVRSPYGETDLRGFEWRYLWNLCRGDQLAILAGHTRTVTATAFSPDGKWLATGSQDGTVKIWDPATHKLIKTVAVTPNAVWSVGFTPDSKHLLTGYDRSVELWSVNSWQVERSFPGELAVLSRNGSILATAESSPFFWESSGKVRLFNWRTGNLLWQSDAGGRALALSPNGELLAIAGPDRGITVWNTTNGKRLRAWPTSEPVWSLDFSPDASRLLSAGWSTAVSIWPLDEFSLPQKISGGELHVWSAIFSGDGQTIVTTSSDQTVRCWDANSLQLKASLHGHGGEVWCAAFSPDGRMIATGGKDQNVLLWPTTSPAPPVELSNDRDFRPLFSPDGKWLATVNPQSDSSVLWNMTNSTNLMAGNAFNDRQIIGFSTGETCAVTLDIQAAQLDFWQSDGNTLQRELTLSKMSPGHATNVFRGLSPDGKFFFGIDATGTIEVWNTGTGQLRCSLPGPPPPIRNAALSPGGNQIAVCVERENVARLYDCDTGAERDLAGHHDFISGLAFSPDGQTLATGSVDGAIRLWNTANGVNIGALSGHMQETSDVAFSPDGRTLASVGRDESVKLWHLPTRREVVSETMTNAGMWLQFSPDGSKLAVATDDNKVRILSAPSE